MTTKHTVTIKASGRQFEVKRGETVLDAALGAGLILPYGCRSGNCGSCKTQIISGSVHYEQALQALTEHEQAAGRALLCQAQCDTDLTIDARETVALQGIEIRTLPARVSSLDKLCHDVMGLCLQLPRAQKFNYLPGQYIDILLRDGRRRSFSMAGPSSEANRIDLHVRLVRDGLFTSQVFNEMAVKDMLRLQGPFGTFFLRHDSERPIILMAGGTGLAPIKAIIEHALAEGNRRPMHLFWGVQQARDLYLDQHLQSLADCNPGLQYTPVLSEPSPQDDWQGETGWVHEMIIRTYPDLSGYEVYASGPPVMIESGRVAFIDNGLQEGDYYYDSFEYSGDVLAAKASK